MHQYIGNNYLLKNVFFLVFLLKTYAKYKHTKVYFLIPYRGKLMSKRFLLSLVVVCGLANAAEVTDVTEVAAVVSEAKEVVVAAAEAVVEVSAEAALEIAEAAKKAAEAAISEEAAAKAAAELAQKTAEAAAEEAKKAAAAAAATAQASLAAEATAKAKLADEAAAVAEKAAAAAAEAKTAAELAKKAAGLAEETAKEASVWTKCVNSNTVVFVCKMVNPLSYSAAVKAMWDAGIKQAFPTLWADHKPVVAGTVLVTTAVATYVAYQKGLFKKAKNWLEAQLA
jgi:cell wall-associated NlpC family hydrolase